MSGIKTIHVPFDPENVTPDDMGWLWIEDKWLLATFFEDRDEFLIAFTCPGYPPADFDWQDAELYRGHPYIPTSPPTCEPGESDLLEVRVSLPGGASVTTVYATEESAERARMAVWGTMAAGHAKWKAEEK